MFTHLDRLLDVAGDRPELILSIVFVAAVVESAFGLGAVLPGETVLVLAAIALHDLPVLIAVVPAAAGAFAGDHIGYAIGARYGQRMAGTRIVRAVGRDRWHSAVGFVERRGFWLIVVARLLPGVRTLVSAAAGTSGLPYRRFAIATGTAAVAWSLLWVVGGGTLGVAFLDYAQQATIPAIALMIAVFVVILGLRRLRKSPVGPRS
ncbi:MAG: DedA family protein [Stackebrandtia sp.]